MSLELELPEPEEELFAHRGLKGFVQSLADRMFRTTARCLLVAAIVVSSLAAVAWNVSRLSILDELAALEVQEYRLGDQLADLEFRLETIDLERISAEIEGENHRIFQGFPELSAWAEWLNMQAQSYALDFSYTVGEPHISPVPDVLEVPVVLVLKSDPKQSGNGFANATALMETILRDHWHIDVLGTEASGNLQGLHSMTVEAQVWVRDRYGFFELSLRTAEPATVNQPAVSS